MKWNIQAKRQHFMSIQLQTVDSDKKFWKTVKPRFANKNLMREKIPLIEDGSLIGIKIYKLKFSNHVKTLCSNVNKKKRCPF